MVKYVSIIIMTLIIFTGCTTVSQLEATIGDVIEKNKLAWDSLNIDNYTYSGTVYYYNEERNRFEYTNESCSVSDGNTLTYTSTVDEEELTHVRRNMKTIDDLFLYLDNAVKRDAVKLDVTFSETEYYPTYIEIYWDKNNFDTFIKLKIDTLSETTP